MSERAVGHHAGRVLDHFGVKAADVITLDDPPGKLKAVKFPWKGRQPPVTVVLHLHYTTDLFSAERTWQPETIRRAIVEAIEPAEAW